MTTPPAGRTLRSWFTASVDKFSDETALIVDGGQLSYAELDAVAGGIATRLKETGATRPRVGVLATRSVAAYAGYLATLQLGGVVVPLNATYPSERLELIARSVGLDCVVADRDQRSPFSGAASPPVLRFGAESVNRLLGGGRPDDAVDSWSADPDDLAYVLFTSGSTGRPKGVPIRHGNLDAFIAFNIERYGVGPGCRLSQTFHLTFDPSVFDMFVAWGSGATLVVPSTDDLFDPVAFINEHQLTHWNSVPSMISMADGAGLLTAASMPSLRWSLFCGEQLTVAQAAAWADAAPHSTVENVYGPTELTVLVTAYRLPRDRSAWPVTGNGTIPIGTPYPHLEIRIDPQYSELQVRGPQRFAGYLDPADNDGRFIDVDIVSAGGAVPGPWAWYRTGDRVGLQDGQLVHLGRLDQQVKILGQRVELQEIESALRRWASVQDAVVVVVANDAHTTDLAAVYTGDPVSARDLRERLLRRLPLHMVPKRYLHRDSLPLNDRGKVDRMACERLLASIGVDGRSDRPGPTG